jgi:hypothetical protein
MPKSLLQNIVNVIANAPMGCGMSGNENVAFCNRILQTAEPPEVAEQAATEAMREASEKAFPGAEDDGGAKPDPIPEA